MLKINTIFLFPILIVLSGCTEVKEEKSDIETYQEKTRTEINNALVTLNEEIQYAPLIESQLDEFKKKLARLGSATASHNEIKQLKQLQKDANQIRFWSRSLNNFYIQESSDLIKASGDPQFGKLDQDTEPSETHYEIISNKNGDITYKIFTFDHLEKKDDFNTPTSYFIGSRDDFFSPIGHYLKDSIMNYRDRLCMIISNYSDKNEKEWEIGNDHIRLDDNSTQASVDMIVKLSNNLSNVNPKDTSILLEIYKSLTYPDNIVNNGQTTPYITNMFDHTPMIAALAMLTSIRSDIATAENIAIKHLESRISIKKFKFNKIEPLAFSNESRIPSGDTVGLKVMVAAYDSIEEINTENLNR